MKNLNPALQALVKCKSSEMSKNFNNLSSSRTISTHPNLIDTNKDNLFPNHFLDLGSK